MNIVLAYVLLSFSCFIDSSTGMLGALSVRQRGNLKYSRSPIGNLNLLSDHIF